MTQESNARERKSPSTSVGLGSTENPPSGDGERDTAVDGIEALHDSQLMIAADGTVGTVGALHDASGMTDKVPLVPQISIREALAAQDEALCVTIPEGALGKASVPQAPHTQRSMTEFGLGDGPRLPLPAPVDDSARARPISIAAPQIPSAHSTLLGMPDDAERRPTLASVSPTARASESYVSADDLAAESRIPPTVASAPVPSVASGRAALATIPEPSEFASPTGASTRTAMVAAPALPSLPVVIGPPQRNAFGAWPVVALLVSLVVIAVGFTLNSRPSNSKVPTTTTLPTSGSMQPAPIASDTAAAVSTGAATPTSVERAIRQSPDLRLAATLTASAAGATAPAAALSAGSSAVASLSTSRGAGSTKPVQAVPGSTKPSGTTPQASAKANSTDPLDLGALLKGE